MQFLYLRWYKRRAIMEGRKAATDPILRKSYNQIYLAVKRGKRELCIAEATAVGIGENWRKQA